MHRKGPDLLLLVLRKINKRKPHQLRKPQFTKTSCGRKFVALEQEAMIFSNTFVISFPSTRFQTDFQARHSLLTVLKGFADLLKPAVVWPSVGCSLFLADPVPPGTSEKV